MTETPASSPGSGRLAWLGTSLTALLLFLSFGPVGHPFWAFIALVPAAVAAAFLPDWRAWRRASFALSWVLWIALLVWLRHVYPPLGWLGLVLLTAYCALDLAGWLCLSAGSSRPAPAPACRRACSRSSASPARGACSSGRVRRSSPASAGCRSRLRRPAIR
jgi:hypothetical protein